MGGRKEGRSKERRKGRKERKKEVSLGSCLRIGKKGSGH